MDAINCANELFGMSHGPEHVIASWKKHQIDKLSTSQQATLKQVCEECIENKENERQIDVIRAKRTLKLL